MSPMTDNFAGSSKMRPTNFPVSPGIMNLGYWRSVEKRICINQNGSPSYSSRQSRNSICTPTSALSVKGTTRCTNYIWPINRCGLFEVSNCLVFDIFIISPAQVQKLPSQKKKYIQFSADSALTGIKTSFEWKKLSGYLFLDLAIFGLEPLI